MGVPGARSDEPAYRVLDEYCPWEDQERLGLLRALVLTARESLFSPVAFFSRLPVRGGFVSPLLYGLIAGTLGAMISGLWGLALKYPFLFKVAQDGNLTVLGGIFIPFFVLLGIVLSAALLHASLFLVGGARQNFEATFRVVCYSSVTELFTVVPVVGWLFGTLWKVYLIIVGLRAVHRISTGKAVVSVFLPAIATCAFIIVAVTLLATGLDLG
jgi:hypothetical protein